MIIFRVRRPRRRFGVVYEVPPTEEVATLSTLCTRLAAAFRKVDAVRVELGREVDPYDPHSRA